MVRRYRRRYRRRATRRNYRKRRTMASLKRQVRSVSRWVKRSKQHATYYQDLNFKIQNGISAYNLSAPINWAALFNTGAQMENQSKAFLKSTTIRITVDPTPELDPIRHSMWLASPRDSANDGFNASSGGFTFTSGLDYATTAGLTTNQAHLNPRRWKIHRYQNQVSGTIPGFGYPVTDNFIQSWRWKLRSRQWIYPASAGGGGNQSWKAQGAPKDPSRNLFLVWIGNDIGGVDTQVDLYVTVYYHVIVM